MLGMYGVGPWGYGKEFREEFGVRSEREQVYEMLRVLMRPDDKQTTANKNVELVFAYVKAVKEVTDKQDEETRKNKFREQKVSDLKSSVQATRAYIEKIESDIPRHEKEILSIKKVSSVYDCHHSSEMTSKGQERMDYLNREVSKDKKTLVELKKKLAGLLKNLEEMGEEPPDEKECDN